MAQASSWMNRWLSKRFAKLVWFGATLLPALWLVIAVSIDHLGANPAEALIRATGDWTLRMLCVVLAITPVRVTFGIPVLARFRRMAGLFVYFYAALHLLAYSGFDMGFDVADIAKDLAKRPFILVGFSAFVLLTLLASTSFNRAIRALGSKRWQSLHRLIYVIALMALLHFFWMRAGKNNFAEVAVYAAVIVALLAWRAARFFGKKLS